MRRTTILNAEEIKRTPLKDAEATFYSEFQNSRLARVLQLLHRAGIHEADKRQAHERREMIKETYTDAVLRRHGAASSSVGIFNDGHGKALCKYLWHRLNKEIRVCWRLSEKTAWSGFM